MREEETRETPTPEVLRLFLDVVADSMPSARAEVAQLRKCVKMYERVMQEFREQDSAR